MNNILLLTVSLLQLLEFEKENRLIMHELELLRHKRTTGEIKYFNRCPHVQNVFTWLIFCKQMTTRAGTSISIFLPIAVSGIKSGQPRKLSVKQKPKLILFFYPTIPLLPAQSNELISF